VTRSRGTRSSTDGNGAMAPPIAAPPLVEAKLSPPRQRAGLVRRPQILERLDAAEAAALTLVVAPAGYGKTTAVRAWCATHDTPFAWVTLDRGDNDPVRLWRYVATAVDRIREGLGRGALQRLAVPVVAIDDVVDELMNALPALGTEVVLVLDDLQAVTNDDCLASLAHAIEHIAVNARIIVLTRADPSLALGRLRARGALAELRSEDLAFTIAETRQVLAAHGGPELERDRIEELHGRTEGWPAAVYLATLWLRNVQDPALAIREFGGGHRFVAQYLSQEVLRGLDERSRSFLERAAVLRRVTPELCDAVLDRDDSADVLATLERSNLFVRRLEHGDWHTIHPLFAEYCELQLRAHEPDAPSRIHLRAGQWLRARALPIEAAEHARAAGDHQLVAELLQDHHLMLLRSGNALTLFRWAAALPDEWLVAYPELAAAAATAAAALGQRGLERRRFLHLVEHARREQPSRFTPYTEAVVNMVRAASIDGGVGRAVQDGARAVDLSRAHADDVLVAALASHARALYLAGAPEEAWTAAKEAVEHPDSEERTMALAMARSTLALVAVDRKRLASARRHAEAARAIVGRVGISRSWVGAGAAASLAIVLAEDGHLAAAERELSAAERFFSDDVPTVHHVWLLVHLARVRCRRGRLEEAAAALRGAEDELGELTDSGFVDAMAAGVRRELDEARLRAESGEVLETPSEAELAVLRLLRSDLSNREIGARLYLSPNTVRSHTRAIYRKLGVSSRADAVARAETLGLVAQT
jgi:LuxR family maltose regulon positive regulatory protein